jgi:hypothetical protein
MRFEIPTNKIQEFDIAFSRLVKWPVYTLYTTKDQNDHKTFELLLYWDSEEEMKKELNSRDFTNMIGMVRVLGNVLQSQVFDISKQADLMEITN